MFINIYNNLSYCLVGADSTHNWSLPIYNNSTYTFNNTYNTNYILFPLIQLYM
jgi:hypothetical protein